MKKIKIVVLSLFSVFLLFGFISYAKINSKTMSYDEASKRWGSVEFKSVDFKNGSITTKAKMAASILKNTPFKNKSVTDVWAALGRHDGYYQNDVVPAYIIDDKENDVWQVVFLVDSDRNITDVIIHKNCCEN